MTDFEGILFDKDGTLFDFEATWTPWAEKFFLKMCDGDHAKAQHLGLVVGFNLDERSFDRDSVVIAGTPEEIVHALAPLFPDFPEAEIVSIMNEEAAAAPMTETVPLIPFLTSLRQRGLKLGVATNDAEAPAIAHVSAVGAEKLFDFICGSDSGYGGKPEAGQILGFCQTMVISPSKVIMVGDSLHDLIAGQTAGCTTIGVLTGLATRDELQPFADVVLENIGEIPSWLDQNETKTTD